MNRFASPKDQPSQPESYSVSMNSVTRDTRKQTKLRPNMTSWLIIARRFRDELSSSVISKPPSVVEKRKKFHCARTWRWNSSRGKRHSKAILFELVTNFSRTEGTWRWEKERQRVLSSVRGDQQEYSIRIVEEGAQQEREIFPHRLEKPTPTSRLVRPGGGGGGVEERHGGVG